MSKLLPHFLAVVFAAGALSTTGCVARVRAGGVVTADPQLVAVSPGVWVVEDYDEPVFYSNDAYWLYRGGLWYRSDVYYGGWTRTAVVPVHVRHINRPRSYVRYHGHAGVRRRAVVRDHRRNERVRSRPAPRRQPAVRDHRRPAPPPRVQTRDHRRPAPPPRVQTRDHRAPPPVKTRDHRTKPKADKRDHRRHE